MTRTVTTWDEFLVEIEKGGFLKARFDGGSEEEREIQESTKATVRVIPFDQPDDEAPCIVTGRPTRREVVFARAY